MRASCLSVLLWSAGALAGSLGLVSVEADGIVYQGVQNTTSGVNSYFGIHYAQAPVGDLRWRAPVPIDHKNQSTSHSNSRISHTRHSTTKYLNATTHGPYCMQNYVTWSTSSDSHDGESEDCLLLDVLTPSSAPANASLPVMVMIHGGGYVTGAADSFPGDALVNQSNGNLVYVSIQYRLGPWGFLAGDDVEADGTANAGLLDQRAALEWVQANIGYFGGDPGKVTVTGGSAGGGSVTMQMIMYGGVEHPPFRAVLPEYPWWTPIYNKTWQNNQYEGVLATTGCADLACLRTLPTLELENATQTACDNAYIAKAFTYGTYYWGPVVDGHVIRADPKVELAAGHFTKVPILTDRDGYEGFFFSNFSMATEAEMVADLRTLWQTDDAQFINDTIALYPTSVYNGTEADQLALLVALEDAEGIEIELSDAFAQREAIFGDALVDCGSAYLARAIAQTGLPSYKMIFNAGAQCHGSTSPFIFSNYTDPNGGYAFGPVELPANATLARYMRDYFISFAVHLDPNVFTSDPSDRAPYWPAYNAGNSTDILKVDFTSIFQEADEDTTEHCQWFWKAGALTDI